MIIRSSVGLNRTGGGGGGGARIIARVMRDHADGRRAMGNVISKNVSAPRFIARRRTFRRGVPKVAPIVDTTRAAVVYFRGDAPVKYSRIKRRQRPGVNWDELDEWEPSPAPGRTRERKTSTDSRLQSECRGVSAARGNPERANRLSSSYFHLDTSMNRR